jgi:hypothetical protein
MTNTVGLFDLVIAALIANGISAVVMVCLAVTVLMLARSFRRRRLGRWWGIAVLLAVHSEVLWASPARELRAAVADCERLPAASRPGVRYLTVYNIPEADRPKTIRTCNAVLNFVSRERAMMRLQQVTPTLFRFSIAHVAADPHAYKVWVQQWEKIAEFDATFHLRTEVAYHGKISQVTTDGGWVGLDNAKRLATLTYSIGAVLRADYFVAAAATPPHYYELAGIPKTEAEFVKSLGLDQQTIDRLRANAGANIIISGVTGKPRRVIWSQGPLGGVYATLDVEKVDAERDPVRRAITVKGEHGVTLTFKFDASEWFAVAPNGLWRVAIFSASGQRQDAVPDKVAKDDSDPDGDGIVLPMISCIRCHRESGLRPFEDVQGKKIAKGFGPHSYDPLLIQRAKEFYDEPRLKRQMEFDRGTYRLAIERCTGLKEPTQFCDEFAEVFRAFAYDAVSIETACREIGCTACEFTAANAKTDDPNIDELNEGRPILRGLWDTSFQSAAIAVDSWRLKK